MAGDTIHSKVYLWWSANGTDMVPVSNSNPLPITGSVSASNPSVGTNTSPAPASSTEVGFIDGSGNLQGVSATNPLPITGTITTSTTDMLNVTGTVSSADVLSNFPKIDCTGYYTVSVEFTTLTAGNTAVAEWSNDGTTWTVLQDQITGALFFTAAGVALFSCYGKQFRLRCSVYSAGSVAANTQFRGAVYFENVNASITGPLPAGSNVIGHVVTDSGSVTNATLQAGAAIVGKVGIDQTTPGTTNGVQVNAALPAGSNNIGSVTVSNASLPATQSGRWTVGLNTAIPAGTNVIGSVGLTGGTDPIDLDNGATPDATLYETIVGDPAGDWAGINIIEQVMDTASGIGFNTIVQNQPLRDPNNALILSDAKFAPLGPVVSGSQIILDTSGYNSIQITTATLTASALASSNDFNTWSAVTGMTVAGVAATTLAANTGYIFPVLGRYFRITTSNAGFGSAYLRNMPFTLGAVGTQTVSVTGTPTVNVTQWGTQNVVTGGVNGTVAVGGNIATGIAPTVNPITVGGTDAGTLTRRFLTDTTGALVVTGPTQQSGSTYTPQRPIQVIEVPNSPTGMDSVLDALNKTVQLLTVIELRLYELPSLINKGQISTDEFPVFQNDPSLFNN